MATLEEALYGLNMTPADTGWGMATKTVGQMTPQLINPYGSTGQAIGISLGSILLQSLLGYQARQEAARSTLEMNTLANQMQELTTPKARTEFIGGVEDPLYQSRLSTLATALGAQETARKAKAAEKLLDLETAAKFEMSDLGQQVQKNKLKQTALAAGIAAGRMPTEYADMFAPVATPNLETTGLDPELVTAIKQLPADKQAQAIVDAVEKKAAQGGSEAAKQQRNAFQTVQDLEQTFRNLKMTGAEFKARSIIPNDPAELAFSKLKGSLAALARVSGQTSQLSDVDLQQQMDSILGPQVPGFGMISGTDSIATRLKQKLKTGQQLVNQNAPDEKLQILRQLQAELAAIKARKGIK